jgi:hypothetical protein
VYISKAQTKLRLLIADYEIFSRDELALLALDNVSGSISVYVVAVLWVR